MSDIIDERTEDEIATTEIPDAALEAAGSAGNSGVYTQFGLCTFSNCGI